MTTTWVGRLGRWRRVVIAAVAVTALGGLAACGGDDVAGLYEHPEEGSFEIDDDGNFTFRQQDEATEGEYEVDGDEIRFEANGEEIEAKIEDDKLTFEEGFSGDEPAVFEKQ